MKNTICRLLIKMESLLLYFALFSSHFMTKWFSEILNQQTYVNWDWRIHFNSCVYSSILIFCLVHNRYPPEKIEISEDFTRSKRWTKWSPIKIRLRSLISFFVASFIICRYSSVLFCCIPFSEDNIPEKIPE